MLLSQLELPYINLKILSKKSNDYLKYWRYSSSIRLLDKTMNNYELLLMFDINQDESTEKTVGKYKDMIAGKGGSIDRFEDWGMMKLAYNIDKHNKARYILLNFEANNEILEELSSLIKFNDNILRHLFIAQDKKITEPSIMMQSRERA